MHMRLILINKNFTRFCGKMILSPEGIEYSIFYCIGISKIPMRTKFMKFCACTTNVV
jgi:hypothetical protein